MSYAPPPLSRPADPVARVFAGAALAVALLALVFAMTGMSQAAPGKSAKQTTVKHKASTKGLPPIVLKPKAYALLRLTKMKKFPSAAIPTVAKAKDADKLGGVTKDQLSLNCGVNQMPLGTWCLDNETFGVPPDEVGQNDYVYAAQTCVKQGGWLPSAAQLIGAAPKMKLSGTIDQDIDTASTDTAPGDGVKDRREMTGDLFTTTAGGSAAGSEGVTAGSKGDPRQGEPDPVPVPSDPRPATLDYVTVYDNYDKGGFAGGAPISQPERFRCAYARVQDPAASGDEG
jgi:hypothetical protein